MGFSAAGVSRVVCAVAQRVRLVCVLLCVVCVRGVCVGGGAGVGVPCTCVCVCVCVCVACGVVQCGVLVGLWLVCAVIGPSPLRRFLFATPRHPWLGFAAAGGGCSSPLLAEGPGCGSPPLLAGVRRRWWCAASRHSWLGLAGCGVSWVGVFLVVCVSRVSGCARWPCCVVCCVFLVSALLVVRCGGAVGVSSARVGVHSCVCVLCRWSVVYCPRLFSLGLAAGVSVVVVGVWCGSLATSS